MSREIIQHKPAYRGNTCWGCGPENPQGLQIESVWEGEECVCTWTPQGHHGAGRPNVLNGGIIAGLIDCHAMCSAGDRFTRREQQENPGSDTVWYCATASLKVDYLKATPMDGPLELRARIVEMSERKAVVVCSVFAAGEETARAEAVAVRVAF